MKHLISLLILALTFGTAQAGLFGDDDLLPVEKAFAAEATAVEADTVRVDWKIADGYYLYRNKLKFQSNTDGIRLGLPTLPAGQVKHDEFFGDMETYRGDIQVTIPITRSPEAGDTLALKIDSQGCADRGICYPPHSRVINIKLPAASKAPGAIETLSSLGTSFGLGASDELLPADEAFQLDVSVEDPQTVVARWQIANDYYMYRDKISVTAAAGSKVGLQPIQLAAGDKKSDEFFGDIEVYHLQTEAQIPLIRSPTDGNRLQLTFTYQGCAEKQGVCYPPINKVMDLVLPPANAASAVTTTPAQTPPTATSSDTGLSEQDALAKRLLEGNTLLTLLAFFGFGLLLAFTPCVFPMIPILSSIIVGQGEHLTARRGFILSTVYVLAMALTYTAAGVFAGLFGENLQAAFQNPWVLSTFAVVFVLLALSMFGFYDIQMPAFIQSRLSDISNRQKGGHLTGVAVMGFLSALIVGPCVAAPLAAALIVIGQTGNAVLGGMALFALSLGMGAPLIAIGTGAGKLLPKAGAWMDAIKAVFGVLLLAVAIWMLERILPGAFTLLLWATLLIVASVYMGALTQLGEHSSGWKKFWKGSGLVMLVYGVVLLIGAASGGSDPLRPLAALQVSGSASTATAATHLSFKRVKTIDDLNRELAAAKTQGRPVLLDFYADWCVSCKEMEKYTFARPEVQQALSGVLLLQADVTANDAEDKALMQHFGIIGPPSIIFYDRDGRQRKDMQLVGFKDADAFVKHVKDLL